MLAGDGCELLPWDTDFFGCRIGRMVGETLDPERVDAVRRWAMQHHLDCLYVLVSAADARAVQLAEQHGLKLVDIRMTLERRLTGAVAPTRVNGNAVIRLARPDDVPYLEDIAQSAHRDSRFYYDSRFPVERCDALYRSWIRQSCSDFADVVWVAQLDDRPMGYVTGHGPRNNGDARIGLVAVGPEGRGQGIGTDLVQRLLGWAWEQGSSVVTVVTQGRNIAAQRLYQRCGFLTREVALWYDWWFT